MAENQVIPEVIEINSPWVELKRVSSRTAVPIERDSGIPALRNFRIISNRIYVLPIPADLENTERALRVFYFRKDENPAGEQDLENGWMKYFPDLFLAEVGMRLASDLEDAAALRYFSTMRDEARRAYDAKVAEEEHAAEVLSF